METNNKRAKDYYYKNHDTLKTRLRERAQAKRDQNQDGIKTVFDAVGEISLALVKIQDVLKALAKTQRASNPIAS
jgi:hypothetical protein